MSTIVHAFIRFCMILNPYNCQQLEISPADHQLVSMGECMRGLMMGNQSEFDYQGARWRIAGGSCKEVDLPTAQIQDRLRASISP